MGMSRTIGIERAQVNECAMFAERAQLPESADRTERALWAESREAA
jgi:hypothetical protein